MMTNPKQLLEQHGILPKKKWGQNFLHDPNTLEKIADTAEITANDTVLEIGPGTGTLTKVLAQRARRVYSVEIDERFIPILEDELYEYDNVEIILDDFLNVQVAQLVGEANYIVVANVPYYITSAILRHLLDSTHSPRRIVMTVQHELAQRMLEQPPDMNLLAVSVQFFGHPQIMNRLKPGVFWPRPAVDSAVIKIDVYDEPVVPVPSTAQFFRVVRAGFGQKRKQLKNSLGSGLGIKSEAAGVLLEKAGIDAKRRAETLALEEWATLTHVIVEELR